MQSPWIPIPHSWREALWLLVAIFIATRKGISENIGSAWKAWKGSAASAHKTEAEAEEIEARTAISTAGLIREMSISMGQASMLRDRLKSEMASKDSIIELQRVKILELESMIPAEEKDGSGGPPAA